jgi:hypothetical protein
VLWPVHQSTGNLLDFRRIRHHNAAMRQRVHVALGVVLVILAGVSAWQVLHSQEHEPVYQESGLPVCLSECAMGEKPTITNMAANAVPEISCTEYEQTRFEFN